MADLPISGLMSPPPTTISGLMPEPNASDIGRSSRYPMGFCIRGSFATNMRSMTSGARAGRLAGGA